MYGLITSLYNEYFGSPTYNLCILGPEESGKTVRTCHYLGSLSHYQVHQSKSIASIKEDDL